MKFLILAVVVSVVQATCPFEKYGDFFRGFALGIQQDPKNVHSDCYLHVDRSVQNTEGLLSSIVYIFEYLLTTEADQTPEQKKKGLSAFEPINWFNTFNIELSDTLTACDTKSMVKQLNFRTQTWSGFLDLLFTLLSASVGGMADEISWFRNELYDAISELFEEIFNQNGDLRCEEYGFAIGLIPKTILNF